MFFRCSVLSCISPGNDEKYPWISHFFYHKGKTCEPSIILSILEIPVSGRCSGMSSINVILPTFGFKHLISSGSISSSSPTRCTNFYSFAFSRCQQTIYQQSHFFELSAKVGTIQKEASLGYFHLQWCHNHYNHFTLHYLD